jgi:hypothetical protein
MDVSQLYDIQEEPGKLTGRRENTVYGVPLEDILMRENPDWENVPGAVPNIVEQCIREIEARGLGEVGLYRVPGSSSAIKSLEDAFGRGQIIDFSQDQYADIHCVCGALKAWFRDLPQPAFPFDTLPAVTKVSQIQDYDEKHNYIREVIHSLPLAHFNLVKRLLEHLDKITDFEDQNQMSAQALATCWAPTVIRAPRDSAFLGAIGPGLVFMRSAITQYHWIFEEQEVEAENDLENEGEEYFDADDNRDSDSPVDNAVEETTDASQSELAYVTPDASMSNMHLNVPTM